MLPKAITRIRDYIRLELNGDSQDDNKTMLMYKLERKYGKSIQELIADTSVTGAVLAEHLGIDKATLSRWRRQFNIQVANPGRYVPADQEGRH